MIVNHLRSTRQNHSPIFGVAQSFCEDRQLAGGQVLVLIDEELVGADSADRIGREIGRANINMRAIRKLNVLDWNRAAMGPQEFAEAGALANTGRQAHAAEQVGLLAPWADKQDLPAWLGDSRV